RRGFRRRHPGVCHRRLERGCLWHRLRTLLRCPRSRGGSLAHVGVSHGRCVRHTSGYHPLQTPIRGILMVLQTVLVHPPCSDREPTAASSTPIYQSATFGISDDGRWDYSRSGNPTREVLETQLALLDGARLSLAYASGVSALASVFRLVPAGGRIVCGRDVYGGTFRLLDLLSRDHSLSVTYVDTTDDAAGETIASINPHLVFVEVPSNPLLNATDVDALRSALPPSTLLVVDSSMLSPVRYRPLEHGADIAVQSGTKLLGGHGDLTAGVVSTNSTSTAEQLRFRQNAEGT